MRKNALLTRAQISLGKSQIKDTMAEPTETVNAGVSLSTFGPSPYLSQSKTMDHCIRASFGFCVDDGIRHI